MVSAEDIKADLLSLVDENQAIILRRFFKTGKDEYGYDDKFVGVKVPQTRAVVKKYFLQTTFDQAVILIKDPIHEVRLCGLLIFVAKFEKACKKRDYQTAELIYQTYLSLHKYVNNWDLVDLTAPKIVGVWQDMHPEDDTMERWIVLDDSALWQRRIAMVSCWWLIKQNKIEQALNRARILVHSSHDLLHKAAGWMLREVYKKGYLDEIEDFLEENIAEMPAIMLSYMTEKMSLQERKYWQSRRRDTRK